MTNAEARGARAVAAALVAAVGVVACAATMPWVADPGYDDALDAHAVLARLAAGRAQSGAGTTGPSQVAQVLLDRAKGRVAEGRAPELAVEHAIEAAANDGERLMHWWMLKVEDLRTMTFPAELATKGRLQIAVAVFRQAPGNRPRYLVALATPVLNDLRRDMPASVGRPASAPPADSAE